MHKKRRKLLCLILALLLFFSSLSGLGALATDLSQEQQQKIDAYKKEQEELDKKINESKEKLNALKDDLEQQQSYVDELQAQIDNYQGKIDALNAQIADLENQKDEIQVKIDALNDRIAEIEKQINHNKLTIIALDQEIEDVKTELQDRLCDLYVYGNASDLELLLASKDFASYLTIAQLKQSMAEHDSEMIATIKDNILQTQALNEEQNILIEEINVKKAEHQSEIDALDAKQAEIEVPKRELEGAQSEIMGLQNEAMHYLNQLDEQTDLYKNLVSKYQAEEKAFQAKIDAIIEEASRKNQTPSFTPSSGLIFPLSGSYISSNFGYRNSLYAGGSTYHGGVDACCYSGTLGKPVMSAASGSVIYSGFNGYGNCIIIDHGNGLVTLYGHLDSKIVSSGQTVNQGQVIGYAGNTYGPGGYSTGPHLHFEVRVNGTKVNPLSYCSP